MTEILIGLDIGGTSLRGAALDAADRTRTPLVELRAATVQGEAGIHAGIQAMVQDLLRKSPAGARIAGLGVGIPGHVVDGTTSHAMNLGLGAEPVDLVPTLRSLTDAPVRVENDVKAAALGIRPWLTAHDPGVDDYALLNVGTGLAAGLVLDGRLRPGATGLAGEIGHLQFDRSGRRCPCGQIGCLELYASGSGLRGRWSGTAAAAFADAAGDPAAAAAVRDLTDGIAHAVTLLAFSPDVARIVVAGGVVTDTPALRAAVVERLRHDDAHLVGRAVPVADRVRWLPADLPAGTIGAALLTVPEGER